MLLYPCILFPIRSYACPQSPPCDRLPCCHRDVPDMLVEWRNAGIKSYIYSSGSREAQRLFFEHSQAGDLRPFLCGFFDTTSGPKTEAASYTNIQHTLGVDDADQVGWWGHR